MSNTMSRNPVLSWIAFLATLAVVALCLRLSWWQLERAEEKRLWLAAQEEKARQPAADLPALLADPAPLHRQAAVSGKLDNTHNVLLDNRIRNGIAGYHLLTPLQTRDNQWVLINRGWLPRGARREQLPEIPAINGRITVAGTVYRPSRETFVLQNAPLPDNQWPLRVQKVDFDAIGEKLGVELAPFEIRVRPDLALGGHPPLPRPWQDIAPMGPDKHKAYALQWFALAMAALLIYVAAAVRNRRKTREEHS